jgi:hypothetical protein
MGKPSLERWRGMPGSMTPFDGWMLKGSLCQPAFVIGFVAESVHLEYQVRRLNFDLLTHSLRKLI